MIKSNAVLENADSLNGIEVIFKNNQSIVISYGGLIFNFGSTFPPVYLGDKRKVTDPDEFKYTYHIEEYKFKYYNTKLSESIFKEPNMDFLGKIIVVNIGPNCDTDDYIKYNEKICNTLKDKLSNSVSKLSLMEIDNILSADYYKDVSYLERHADSIKAFFGLKSRRDDYLKNRYLIDILPIKLNVMITNAIKKTNDTISKEQMEYLKSLKVASVFLISSPYFNNRESSIIQLYI